MKTSFSSMPRIPGARRRAVLGLALEGTGLAALTAVVVLSAIVTKEMQSRGGLAALVAMNAAAAAPMSTAPDLNLAPVAFAADPLAGSREAEAPAVEPTPAIILAAETVEAETIEEAPATRGTAAPIPEGMEDELDLRWFNGRPVRPAKTITMTVTAYSPDWRSCAPFADGITASLHSVTANGGKLVAADSRVLPLGSMITVPGYHADKIVPVLDRGGKIKGNRLDVLFPTHESALKWGVRRVKVVVWEYADGKGAEPWRKIRDSKR